MGGSHGFAINRPSIIQIKCPHRKGTTPAVNGVVVVEPGRVTRAVLKGNAVSRNGFLSPTSQGPLSPCVRRSDRFRVAERLMTAWLVPKRIDKKCAFYRLGTDQARRGTMRLSEMDPFGLSRIYCVMLQLSTVTQLTLLQFDMDWCFMPTNFHNDIGKRK